MGKIVDFTKETKPKIYHYTSCEALQAILNNNSLRFTDSQFLNDKSEFSAMLEVIKDIQRDTTSPSLSQILEQSQTLINVYFGMKFDAKSDNIWNCRLLKTRFYVLSCSRDSDSLPMWNYYSKNSNSWGYNLELKINNIIDKVSEIRDVVLYQGQVIYSKKDMRDILEKRFLEIENKHLSEIKKIQAMPLSKEEKDEELMCLWSEIENEIADTILLTRMFYKEKYFKHESEYRFVLEVPISFAPDGVIRQFSTINGVIRPHIDVLFNDSSFHNKITISPLIDYELAKEGLNLFFAHNDIKIDKEKIIQSKVQIRF